MGPAPVAADGSVRILAFGDSLMAGLGLPADVAFPRQLERALHARDVDATVINAGVSGDTMAGGRARLKWTLQDHPDVVIVALGANDAMRALPPEDTRQNLDAILQRLTERDLAVLLAGMYAPPNIGADYARAFNRIYPELAVKHNVALYPFFLDGVAMDPRLNQPDGIHPNRQGVAVMVERILPYLLPLIAAQTSPAGDPITP